MSFRRSLSWASALRDLRSDRAIVPAGLASARALAQCYSRVHNLPLVVGGQYDRRAIMTVASLAAKAHQARTGATWAASLSVALKATWQAAKAARRSATH